MTETLIPTPTPTPTPTETPTEPLWSFAKRTGHLYAYLGDPLGADHRLLSHRDALALGFRAFVIDWNGHVISGAVALAKPAVQSGRFGRRHHVSWNAPDGFVWSGTTPADSGTYVHLRRTKRTWRR